MRQSDGSLFDVWLNRGKLDRNAVDKARRAVADRKPAVVVTGGSRGIGLAIAHRFAAAARDVVLVARDPDALITAASAVRVVQNRPVPTIACDVTSPDAPSIISAALHDAGYYLDVLVNNAASGLAGPFAENPAADIDAMLALNVASLTRLTRAGLPDMLARRRGGILNIASLGAYVPGPHQAVYYASKAFVLSLTEAIATENAGQGVRISVVLPGPVDTGFHAAMGADRSLYRQVLPSLTPERVAQSAYRGYLRGQRVIVPGLFNRATLLVLRALPHPVSVPLVSVLLKRPEK